ncbi:uncharacterized protein At3g27210-like [Ipomoea triloba]|uniref:uncharacterized protein At3g27210-like n=1 Tax=Ipomoea triloba TaxID=35885 RepID=UPI00125E85F6|nr:uncharacterized protein At3g27210-like [Ipomoea triloba]
MGSCVSAHRDPESSMKQRLVIGSKNGKLVIPSPLKSKPTVVNGADIKVTGLPLHSQHSSPHPMIIGSKEEEMFFDSQPWLESDCEDDFYSIKGDFSPSCGNTPVLRQSFSEGTPVIFRDRATISVNVIESSSPTDEKKKKKKKKKLSELLREISLQGNLQLQEEDINVQKDGETTGIDPTTVKVAVETPPSHSSVRSSSSSSSETTPDREFKPVSKSAKSGHCCLPRLLSSRSSCFNEKRKKMASPVHSVS